MTLSPASWVATLAILCWSACPAISAQSAGIRDAAARTTTELNSCRPHQVTGFPGSGKFGSDFIEAIATDPARSNSEAGNIWALTADLSDQVPWQDRALYISRSSDGGSSWSEVARIDSRYFNAKLGEGLRNGFTVVPGAKSFIITTQLGAFEVSTRPGTAQPVIVPIDGPRFSQATPKVLVPQKPGDAIPGNIVAITPDGKHLIIGYGHFDLEPKLFAYHRDENGFWVSDGPIPSPPTEMDLLSVRYDDPNAANPGFLYVGTGDQVYILNLRTRRWDRIDGVGPDSAIHDMSVVGGLHLAACWGVYNPAGPGMVRRITRASFLLHRGEDEAGSNVRAYSVDVDPFRPAREIITSLTGVYISGNRGETWARINDLPDEEFRTSHINPDGTILVSGIAGTFLLDPFSDACSPRLKMRHNRP